MAAKLAVAENNWMLGDIRALQPGGHFAGMEGIAVPVGVTGNDHRGRVGCARENLVIWRIFCQGCEIVGVIGRTEFIYPDMRVVKEVVSKHVEHRGHADHSAKQIRSLGQSSSDEQA